MCSRKNIIDRVTFLILVLKSREAHFPFFFLSFHGQIKKNTGTFRLNPHRLFLRIYFYRNVRINYILEGRNDDDVHNDVHTQLSPLRLFCVKVYFVVVVKGTHSANQMQDSQTPDNPLIVKSMVIDEAGDETGERSTEWVRALKGFCETTTFRGLRNVAGSTSNSVRR